MEQSNNKINLNLRRPIILISLSSGVLAYLLTILASAKNMSAIGIGGLFSIVSLIILVLKPFVGRASDRVGRKPLLAGSMIMYCVSFITFSFATSSAILYFARSIQGIAAVLYSISTYGLITDTYGNENLSEAFGSLSAFSSTGVFYGFILTSLVFSSMSFFDGWNLIFYIFAGAAFIAFTLVLKHVPETKTIIATPDKTSKKLSGEAIKILFINFITSASSSMLSPIVLIYLMNKFPNNFNAISVAYLSSIVVASILGKRIGRLGDFLGKKKALVLGLIVSGFVSLFIPTTNSIIILAVLWCIQVVGSYLEGPAESSIYSRETEESSHGELYGIYSSIGSLGAIVGPLLGGFIYEKISHGMTFYIDGFIFIIVGIISIWAIKNDTTLKKQDDIINSL